MNNPERGSSPPSFETAKDGKGTLTLKPGGRLDAYTTSGLWDKAEDALTKEKPENVVVDASGIDYMDASGMALLIELRLMQEKSRRRVRDNRPQGRPPEAVRPFRPRELRPA